MRSAGCKRSITSSGILANVSSACSTCSVSDSKVGKCCSRVKRSAAGTPEAVPYLGNKGFGHSAGVLLRAILHQEDGWGGMLQHTREEGHVRCGIETAFLPLIQETSRAVLDQTKDLIACPLARGFDHRLLPTPRPHVCERAPRRKAGFIAKPQQGLLGLRLPQHLRPRGGTLLLPLALLEMIRDASRFLMG